jgi:hypothetical protein
MSYPCIPVFPCGLMNLTTEAEGYKFMMLLVIHTMIALLTDLYIFLLSTSQNEFLHGNDFPSVLLHSNYLITWKINKYVQIPHTETNKLFCKKTHVGTWIPSFTTQCLKQLPPSQWFILILVLSCFHIYCVGVSISGFLQSFQVNGRTVSRNKL